MFQGVPNFAPEILRRVRLEDAMKAKKLKEALQQMAEEGVVQLFSPEDGSPAIVGVVGALQLDVLKERLSGGIRPAGRFRDGALFGLPLDFRRPAGRARKIHHQPSRRHRPRSRRRSGASSPQDGFSLNYEADRAPGMVFEAIKDYQVRAKAA